MTLEEVVDKAVSYRAHHICVTGGEPLAQPSCLLLLKALCDRGLGVSLETSGAMDVSKVDPRVSIVMDIKTPGSGEVNKNLWSNIDFLKKKDQLKFVLCSKTDFDWMSFKINELNLLGRVGEVFVSPSYEAISPNELAEWVLESKLKIRMQVQLHKLLWGDKPGV